ncbi:hypothetical protein BGZ99_003262 [Dissophora globulifera]|uniref:Uncharacterized protein n=1 Tax=Dissophora globulifera TaxID=979702 RepID=A0A9P6RLR9_9FUNG|nr:hypothetical protein BGZ99_003262 [Dissophora globulifera]
MGRPGRLGIWSPTCEQFVGQTDSIRRLYCYQCKKYMHRDSMAGHNIVNIARNQVEKQERPLYLHPVDKDGKYPWLERGDKGGSSPKDGLSPSQQGGGGDSQKRKTKKDGDADREQGSKRAKGITPTVVTRQDSSITKDDMAIMAKLKQTTGKGKAVVDWHMQIDS